MIGQAVPAGTLVCVRALPLRHTLSPHKCQQPAPLPSCLVGWVERRCCCCGWSHHWGSWANSGGEPPLVICWGALSSGLSRTDEQGCACCYSRIQQVWWGVRWCNAECSSVACAHALPALLLWPAKSDLKSWPNLWAIAGLAHPSGNSVVWPGGACSAHLICTAVYSSRARLLLAYLALAKPSSCKLAKLLTHTVPTRSLSTHPCYATRCLILAGPCLALLQQQASINYLPTHSTNICFGTAAKTNTAQAVAAAASRWVWSTNKICWPDLEGGVVALGEAE
jgi:hypothetical protein